ncbi:MAG: FtsX-like permease family protein [Acidimicrobiales bacterium]
MLSRLSSSPWRRAPLLVARQPVVALAMTITVALLGLTIGSFSVYLASAGSASMSMQEAQYCPSGLDSSVTGSGPLAGVGTATQSLLNKSNADLVAAGASAGDLQAPIVTLSAENVAIRSTADPRGRFNLFQFLTRTDGLSNIVVLSDAGGPGIWLSNDLASSMGVRAGGFVTMASEQAGSTAPSSGAMPRVRVAGIYESLVGTSLPRFWCTQTSIFGTPDSALPPPPVVLTSAAVFTSVLRSLHIPYVSSYQWERMLSPGLTVPTSANVLAGMQKLTRSIGILSNRHQVTSNPLGGGIEGFSYVDTELVFVVQHAEAIQRALKSGILPVALAGLAVTLLLVAAAGSYWVDRRRLEVMLLSAKGASPGAIGAKAALENSIPAFMGAVIGWAMAYGLVTGIGPSSAIPPGSTVEALWTALIGAFIALLLVWIIASFRTRGATAPPRITSRQLGRIPFELIPLGISIWAWSTLGQQSLQASGASAPGVGAAYLVFPILFVLSIAVLSARIAAMVISAGWFRKATSNLADPLWLASRRLSGSPRIAALCLASVAAATGVLIYGSALTTSQNLTLDAKAAVFVGSATSVQLYPPAPIPASLASTSTEVLSSPNGTLGGQTVDVIGVDPNTFARGAFWNPSFSNQSLQSLLKQLSPEGPGDPLRVIIAGGQGLGGALRLQVYGQFSAALPVSVVSYASEFPGEDSQDPLVITSDAGLSRFHVATTEIIWSRSPDQVVLSDLQKARDVPAILVSTENVLNETTFEAITWTFAYLQALGILSGAVIVGGLLLFVSTRARARALAYVLSRRMGLRRITHWTSLIIEIGVMIAPGAVIGGFVGWAAVVLAEPHLNPLPLLDPPPLLQVPVAVIIGASAAALGVWALVSSWAQHVADRSRAAELLRAEG